MNKQTTKKPPKRHPLRKTRRSPVLEKTQNKTSKTDPKQQINRVKQKLPKLTPKQFQYLKAKAHNLKPLVLIGEKGITDNTVNAVMEALDFHELIKVRLREPEDKKTMAQDLAKRSNSILVALRGHTVILFRPKIEDSSYKLPTT